MPAAPGCVSPTIPIHKYTAAAGAQTHVTLSKGYENERERERVQELWSFDWMWIAFPVIKISAEGQTARPGAHITINPRIDLNTRVCRRRIVEVCATTTVSIPLWKIFTLFWFRTRYVRPLALNDLRGRVLLSSLRANTNTTASVPFASRFPIVLPNVNSLPCWTALKVLLYVTSTVYFFERTAFSKRTSTQI